MEQWARTRHLLATLVIATSHTIGSRHPLLIGSFAETTLQSLRVLIEEGDASWTTLAERAVDNLVISNVGNPQMQINLLHVLDAVLRLER